MIFKTRSWIGIRAPTFISIFSILNPAGSHVGSGRAITFFAVLSCSNCPREIPGKRLSPVLTCATRPNVQRISMKEVKIICFIMLSVLFFGPDPDEVYQRLGRFFQSLARVKLELSVKIMPAGEQVWRRQAAGG